MKKLSTVILITLSAIFVACENGEETRTIVQGDYPIKECFLERSPNVNAWGAEINFSYTDTSLTQADLDYHYLSEDETFSADVIFYTANAYYTNADGDLVSEGCPALFVHQDCKAYEVGIGTADFDSLITITNTEIALLEQDYNIDLSICKDSTTGFYDRSLLFDEYDKCIIGRSFRTRVLTIPEGRTESDMQPVYLIKTADGIYAKFMVKQFKGSGANKKKTQFMWQVISKE